MLPLLSIHRLLLRLQQQLLHFLPELQQKRCMLQQTATRNGLGIPCYLQIYTCAAVGAAVVVAAAAVAAAVAAAAAAARVGVSLLQHEVIFLQSKMAVERRCRETRKKIIRMQGQPCCPWPCCCCCCCCRCCYCVCCCCLCCNGRAICSSSRRSSSSRSSSSSIGDAGIEREGGLHEGSGKGRDCSKISLEQQRSARSCLLSNEDCPSPAESADEKMHSDLFSSSCCCCCRCNT